MVIVVECRLLNLDKNDAFSLVNSIMFYGRKETSIVCVIPES